MITMDTQCLTWFLVQLDILWQTVGSDQVGRPCRRLTTEDALSRGQPSFDVNRASRPQD